MGITVAGTSQVVQQVVQQSTPLPDPKQTDPPVQTTPPAQTEPTAAATDATEGATTVTTPPTDVDTPTTNTDTEAPPTTTDTADTDAPPATTDTPPGTTPPSGGPEGETTDDTKGGGKDDDPVQQNGGGKIDDPVQQVPDKDDKPSQVDGENGGPEDKSNKDDVSDKNGGGVVQQNPGQVDGDKGGPVQQHFFPPHHKFHDHGHKFGHHHAPGQVAGVKSDVLGDSGPPPPDMDTPPGGDITPPDIFDEKTDGGGPIQKDVTQDTKSSDMLSDLLNKITDLIAQLTSLLGGGTMQGKAGAAGIFDDFPPPVGGGFNGKGKAAKSDAKAGADIGGKEILDEKPTDKLGGNDRKGKKKKGGRHHDGGGNKINKGGPRNN